MALSQKNITILIVAIIFSLTANIAVLAADKKNKNPAVQAEKQKIEKLKATVELGDTNAMQELANAYMDGTGVEKNFEKAFELYNIASAQGNNNAMLALAVIYSEGVNNIDKSRKEGFKWFLKAAEWGNQIAQFTIGTIYAQGFPEGEIPVDIEKAYKWLRIAGSSDGIPRVKKAASGLADMLIEKLDAAQLKKLEDEIKYWQPKTGPLN